MFGWTGIKYIIFYGSYFVFPFIFFIGWLYWKKKISLLFLSFLLLGSSIFIWARFIEPNMLVVHETAYEVDSEQSEKTTLRIIIYSDLHQGIFRNESDLEREIKKINALQGDVVFIPGDFVYKMPEDDLAIAFAALKQIDVPVYAVLGNHDSDPPGEYPSEVIRDAIRPYGVTFVDNKKQEFVIKNKKIML